jgi:hypothetical protein
LIETIFPHPGERGPRLFDRKITFEFYTGKGGSTAISGARLYPKAKQRPFRANFDRDREKWRLLGGEKGIRKPHWRRV